MNIDIATEHNVTTNKAQSNHPLFVASDKIANVVTNPGKSTNDEFASSM